MKLLNCPFCGSDNVELRSDFNEQIGDECRTAYVKCWDCHAMSDTKCTCTGGSEAEAIAAWNKRAGWISVDDILELKLSTEIINKIAAKLNKSRCPGELNCGHDCHYAGKPYGFIPEADCPIHDVPEKPPLI